MKRPILALLLAAVTVVGCGRGKTGAQGDTGPQGPPGPISDPPHITSITPEYGSSRTVFTIHGEHFGAVASADTIYVGDETGAKLQVISASTTEIKFTGAFEPVLEQTAMPVSIEVMNQVSNPILIQAMPSGSIRDTGLGNRVYGTPTQIATSATTLYVLDASRGVFAQDLGTGEITTVVLVGQSGVKTPQQIYVSPSGTLMLVDLDMNGFQRLLARQPDGSWDVVVRFGNSLPAPITIGFGPAGDMLVVTSTKLQYVNANGTLGWSNTYTGGYTPVSMTTVGAKFYLTFRYNGGAWANIDAIDASGGQTLVGPAVTYPTLLTSDGSYLYVLDSGTTFKRIDPTNGVTTAFGGNAGHTVAALASGSAGRLFQADTSCGYVFRVGATENTIASAGLTNIQQLAGGAAGDLLASTMPIAAGGDMMAALLEFPAQGPARLIDATHRFTWLEHEGTKALYVDGIERSVDEIDLASGVVTKLAGTDEGLVNPTGATRGPDGTLYVVDQPTAGTTNVGTISGGTVHAGFATANVPLVGAMVSGQKLFLTGTSGVYGVPLTGGTIALLTTEPNAPVFAFQSTWYTGGFAPDGAGGVYM